MGWRPRIIDGGGAGDGPPAAPTDASAPGEPSDADLTRATLEGLGVDGRPERPRPGHEAFAVLVRRHQGRVLALAVHLTGNVEDARDVTQDAFLRAYRSLASYRPDLSFRNWLLRIAVNAAHDHRARSQARHLRPLHEVPEPSSGEDVAAMAEGAVLLGQVRLATRELPTREREVFVLRDLEGLEIEEVAKVLGIAEPTVRRHLARARLRLRELLSGTRR